MKKGSNLDEQHLYEYCWNGNWKCNLVNQEQWLDIPTIIIFSCSGKYNKQKSN
jgi:hypothetical protein